MRDLRKTFPTWVNDNIYRDMILTDDILLEKASLKRTSLSDLAKLVGVDETMFIRKFIKYDREVRK